MNTPKKAKRADVAAALEELDAAPVFDLKEHESRKHLAASKQRRQDLSDDELLLEYLFDLFDFDAAERGFLHALIARSLGKAPEQKVFVDEVALGRQVGGDGYVLEGSLRRRARRMFAQIEEKQRAAGRVAVRRKPGKVVDAGGKESGTNRRFAQGRKKRLEGAEYFFPVAQAVVDGVEAARPGNQRRAVRFRSAARLVFDSLPECKPLATSRVVTPFVRAAEDVREESAPGEVFERVTGETSPESPSAVPKTSEAEQPRPFKRFKDNAALALRIAREKDARKGDGSDDEFRRARALLHVELMRTAAELGTGDVVETEAAIRETIALLESLLEKPAELSSIVADTDTGLATKKSLLDNAPGVSHFPGAETSKPQQKPHSDHRKLDKSVQPKGRPGRIPDEVVERVRGEADIVRVVQSRGVKLTRAGSQYKGLCPFHQEKTPSFFVSPRKGLYYCQGCGEGGNVFNFVANLDRVGFRDALQTVAGLCSIPLPDEAFAPVEKPPAARAVRELRVEPDPGAFAEDYEL